MKLKALLALALTFLTGCSIAGELLKAGAAAPAVTVKNDEGKDVDLGAEAAKGYLLVYFYPKADTPGCTKQACSLRDSWKSVQDKGVKVYGVSMDTVEAQKAFREKHSLPFSLLADTEGKVVTAYGVTQMRKGIPKRQSVLIKDGKVIWSNADVKPDTHLAEVLEQVK